MKKLMRQSKRHMHRHLRHAVIRTNTGDETKQLFIETDRYSPLRGDAIGVGAIYNQHTQHWLVWLSTNGLDITVLCAHEDQEEADAVVNAITVAAQSGDFVDAMKVPMLLGQWRSSGIQEPSLPEDILATIGRALLHHVVPLYAPACSTA
jgi:hypothetical protein